MINLPKVLGRVLTAIGDDFIAYLGALVEVAEPRFLDGRDVHEYALAACIGLNKSEPFVGLNHLTVANVVTPCLIFLEMLWVSLDGTAQDQISAFFA